jgi:dTDP-4-dehydrorhamnose 3,5-epimerase
MFVERLRISEIVAIKPARYEDERGFFSETYNRRALAEVGIETEFVQDNHSLSVPQGTLRGLHFQAPPTAQAKLVSVVRGAMLDVAVDLRVGSPSFGQHVCCELSAREWNQIYIPQGFAHGFCTLEPDTEVTYKVSDYYAPELDRGLMWNDPALGIDWPISDPLLSEKDRSHPPLRDLPQYFTYKQIINE